MAFDNQTNHKRVTKIIEILDLIEASRVSNKASVPEMDTILKPLMERLGTTPAAPVQAPVEAVARSYSMAPHPWSTIKQCVKKATMKDLMVAQAQIMTRIDEYIYDTENAKKV
tara:strand:- start:2178 stop:2516 length:339 start_codon:yes stop_codon:yes gene_type:complete